MKVLHVINWLRIGGSENLLVNHVSHLAEIAPEIENHVCVLGARAAAEAGYLARLPVKPVFLELPADYRRPSAMLRYVRGLRRVVREIKPDIVHSYLWAADFFCALAAFGINVRRVSHVLDRRGNRDSLRLNERWRVRTTGLLLRSGDTRFVAVSEACRAHAMVQYRVKPWNIVTAHNGIDPAAFVPSSTPVFSRSPAKIGTISRFAEEKGHRYLIDAFEEFAVRNAGATLAVGGSGRGLEEFRALVAAKGLAERVEILGRVPSAADFYRNIDAFVVPSIDAEGLPTTILEAMATGLPVIATDVGGASEAIEHGRQGLIVRPRDPAALADAMHRLLADPDAARRMGRAGRQRVEQHFTVDAMTGKILHEIYGSALVGNAAKLVGAMSDHLTLGPTS